MSNGDTTSNGSARTAAAESGITSDARPEPVGVISELRHENEQLMDRAIRSAAEIENLRRRGERAAKDASQFAITAFARDMLAVSDNLKRAIEASDEAVTGRTGHDALGEGVRATERLLASVLIKFGVTKIDAAGSRFDPDFHDAIMVTADSELPVGTVVQVVEDGYKIYDRLLRPARVVLVEAKPVLRKGGLDGDRSL